MKGSKVPRTLSQEVILTVATAILVLCLPATLDSPAYGQQAPPEDAPVDAFPAGGPATGQTPPDTPLQPEPDAPLMIGGGIWLAQGPGPAISGQVEAITPGPNEVSGAIHTVAAHPTDADTLYAGGANGGIWKTTNATAASPFWTPLTDSETSNAIGALEFDPLDGTAMTLMAGIGNYSSFGSLGGSLAGLLGTTDGGATWVPVTGGGTLAPVSISGVAPRGTTIVASSNLATPFTCGLIGIWRSVDGGVTFAQVSPMSAVPGPVGVAFDLAGDPATPSTLYSAMTFVGSTCSPMSGFTNGVYKSTDTGLTWVKVSDAVMDGLIVDGTTNNVEIAADGLDVFVNIVQSGRSVGIFHSPDGGTTWSPMDLPRTPEIAPMPIILIVPGSPILVDTGIPHGLSSGMEVEIMGVTSTFGANGVWTISITSPTMFTLTGSADFMPWIPAMPPETWVKVVGLNPRIKPGSQGGVHASIRTDPLTPSTVYLGGDRQDFPFPNFIGAMDFSGRLFRGDATVPPSGAIPSPQWEHLTHLIGPPTPGGGTLSGTAPHADSREMVFDADGDLIEVDDGGIYRRTSPATDGGDWFSINGNIQVTEQHDVAYDSVSNILISGNQDTGTTQQMTSGSLTWDSIHTADGGDVAVDDFTAAPGVSTRYSSLQFLVSFRRIEYDTTNSPLSTVFPTLIPLGLVTPLTNFVTPVELNAVTPTSLVIGGCNAVFESFDKGDTIVDILGLFDLDCTPPVMTFPQNAMAYGGVSGGVPNADVLYVGSGSLLYARSTPGAVAFVSAYPGTATIRDLVIDPAEWMDVFVVESNLSGGGPPAPPFFSKVWWSTDAGISWTDITGNLTDPGLQATVFVPGATDRLLVGGRDGVFELTMPPVFPYTWGELGTGLPNVPVWDMEYDAVDDVILAGTLGRGAWILQENGTCGFPKNLKVENQMVDSTTTFTACNNIEAGPALDLEGNVLLKAGIRVTFLNGVTLDDDVEVEIDASLISP